MLSSAWLPLGVHLLLSPGCGSGKEEVQGVFCLYDPTRHLNSSFIAPNLIPGPYTQRVLGQVISSWRPYALVKFIQKEKGKRGS